MKTLVVGAGAVGGYFGGRLARAGEDVTFLARGETLEALRRGGLRIDSAVHDSFRIRPVQALAPGETGGPFGLVLVCVKVPQTAAALVGLAASLAPEPVVLSLQNGVESEETVARLLGLGPIPRAVAHVGAETEAPGRIRHASGGRIVFGEPDGNRSPRLDRVAALFDRAAIRYEIRDDMARVQWQKLAWNASFNLVCAISGRNVGTVLADPQARALVETAMTEIESVAAALGIPFEEDHRARVFRYTERELGEVRPSTLQDRDRGRPLEHDALTGAVLRAAERTGVPTPVCRSLDVLAALLSRVEPA